MASLDSGLLVVVAILVFCIIVLVRKLFIFLPTFKVRNVLVRTTFIFSPL